MLLKNNNKTIYYWLVFKNVNEIYGVGAKSQILSSVAPPGRKTWLLFSGRDMSWGHRNPCFTKFSVDSFL